MKITVADRLRRSLARAAVATMLVVACLGLETDAVAAQGTDARPLLVEGRSTVYQRVLTRPGAVLHAEPGAPALRRYPPFQPLYVYGGAPGWSQVGRGLRGPEGWIEASRLVSWRQTIVGAFTLPVDRNRQILFDSAENLQALLSHEALLDLQPRILAEAEGGTPPAGRGVVALEPETHVDIRRQFYVLPILEFIEDFHPLTYDANLLLKVASLPLDETPPPPQAGRFDAGIVFLLDTTMSMDPFIDRTGRAMERLVNELLATDAGATVNFGVVAFRDNNTAVPGLEYRTRVLLPLERRTDQTPVLAAIREATRVATVSSPGFNEDSLAGVEDALREIVWEPEGDPFDARVIVLVTDAGPKDPRDPNARSDLGADELRREAQERRVPVMTLHLRTASGGAAQHAYAEAQYRILSRFEGGTYYYPIEGGDAAAFEATMTRLLGSLITVIRAARENAPDTGTVDVDPSMRELGLALRIAWLGRAQGATAPDVIEGWISERAAENPAALAVEPRLMITKNEMATMADFLAGMLDAAEANRAAEDAERFFAQVRALVAQMAENPDRLVAAGAATPGAALEFLEDLPYRSQLMQITPDRWAQNAIERRRITDGMRQKLAQYRKWLFDPTVWTALYEGAPDGEHVYAMPFDALP